MVNKAKCQHGFFNCLLSSNLYFPTSSEGVSKYVKLVLEHPLSPEETVFLKSKIIANVERIKDEQQTKLTQEEVIPIEGKSVDEQE